MNSSVLKALAIFLVICVCLETVESGRIRFRSRGYYGGYYPGYYKFKYSARPYYYGGYYGGYGYPGYYGYRGYYGYPGFYGKVKYRYYGW